MNERPCTAAVTTGARNARHRHGGVSNLMYAAQQGNVDKVRRILRAQSSKLFERDRTGKSALHYCTTSDSICAAQAADLLVMAAPDLIESRDEDGFTPLHLAVIAGNMQLVTFLLANKADVNAVDNEKHTVVHWATVCGETAALRAVLAAGAPVSTPDVHGGYPLHYAAQMCGGERDSSLGMQVLQTLLGHTDISVSVMDGDKRQPLLWAASAGSARAILSLVRAGAAVESCDKDGLTALHCAASRGHTDCIDTLLTLCGASPDVIDSNGCTALHYAVTLGHADATALLLAHGADPNRQDRKGRSPAHCGCAKGQFETVKMIGAHGANLWLRNARGDLPLHEAAASGRRELVKWLLEMRPSQVNSRNNDGRCPLHMAALNDNSDMCKILLDAGAQVNPILRTSKNVFMTPLDCALQRGFRSTAKYLQLHGGVPASRLGDGHFQQVGNSAISLQIRDDVTFWGDTSSDSERENGDIEKGSRKTLRKKLAYKYDRKKASMSGSDVEIDKVRINKVESGPKRKLKEKNRGSKSTSRTNTSGCMDSRRSSSRVKSQLDYSNEIVINGTTEINIHQTKEIIVDQGSEVYEKTETEMFIPDDSQYQSASTTEKERRPKSAKYNKVKSGTGTREKSGKLIGILKEQSTLKDQSTNTSDETTETVIDNFKNRINVESTIKVNDKTLTDYHDQQSLMSNTSEEVTEQRDIVVEASVHPPPKEADIKIITEMEVDKEGAEKGDTGKDKVENEAFGEPVNKEKVDVETKILEVVVTKDTKEKESDILVKQEVPETQESPPLTEVKLNEEIKDTQTLPSKESPRIDIQISPKTTEEKEIKSPQDKKEVDLSTTADVANNEPSKIDTGDIEKGENIEKAITKENAEDIKEQTAGVENKDETADDSKLDTITTEDKAIIKVIKSEDENSDITKEINTTGAILKIIRSEDECSDTTKGGDKNDPASIKPKEECKSPKGKRTKKAKLTKTKVQEERDSVEVKSEDEVGSSLSSDSSSSAQKTHKSFQVLDNGNKLDGKSKRVKSRNSRSKEKAKLRSRSEEMKAKDASQERVKNKKSKIPTPVVNGILSKSDKSVDRVGKTERKFKSSLDARVPSLPNIEDSRGPYIPRSDSNMSAPLLNSVYSDNERGSGSDMDEQRTSSVRRKRTKRKTRARESRSAGSDYESSNLIDSGFEPSPRSTRIPRWKNMSLRGVNMTTVTQTIQSNIRRYHLERKIFQHLLELKRFQIRSNQHNESILVKRAIDAYHQSCAATVGAGRYVPEDYTFKSFEKFLYESLRKLQKNGVEYLKGLPETANPLHCTLSTNRCMHTTHAYTGVPCAAYLPKMDHHSIPKIGFQDSCKPGTGFLPTINPKKAVTLELSHGPEKQVISLPTDRLDQNKRYYVTFTVKGHENSSTPEENTANSHRHSKSD